MKKIMIVLMVIIGVSGLFFAQEPASQASSTSNQTAGAASQTARVSGQVADVSNKTVGATNQASGVAGQTASVPGKAADAPRQVAETSSQGSTALQASKSLAAKAKTTIDNRRYRANIQDIGATPFRFEGAAKELSTTIAKGKKTLGKDFLTDKDIEKGLASHTKTLNKDLEARAKARAYIHKSDASVTYNKDWTTDDYEKKLEARKKVFDNLKAEVDGKAKAILDLTKAYNESPSDQNREALEAAKSGYNEVLKEITVAQDRFEVAKEQVEISKKMSGEGMFGRTGAAFEKSRVEKTQKKEAQVRREQVGKTLTTPPVEGEKKQEGAPLESTEALKKSLAQKDDARLIGKAKDKALSEMEIKSHVGDYMVSVVKELDAYNASVSKSMKKEMFFSSLLGVSEEIGASDILSKQVQALEQVRASAEGLFAQKNRLTELMKDPSLNMEKIMQQSEKFSDLEREHQTKIAELVEVRESVRTMTEQQRKILSERIKGIEQSSKAREQAAKEGRLKVPEVRRAVER